MASYIALNNARAALAVAISDSDTSIVVQPGYGVKFAVGSDYTYATLASVSHSLIEIVKITARNGDILAVVRGQDGTTAIPWNAEDVIECRPCAAAVEDIKPGGVALPLPVSVEQGGTGATTAADARAALDAQQTLELPLSIAQGGTGATTAADARAALDAQQTLALPLPVEQGGTGATTVEDARAALGIQQTIAFPLAVAQGGTGASTAAGARAALDAQQTLAFPLAIAQGGTSATTAAGARAALDAQQTITSANAPSVRIALGLPTATKAEMEAGTESAPRSMSPLNIKQAVDALALGGGGDGLGVGQTWQDMAGSRALETTYTNSTGKPIAVSVGGVSVIDTLGSMTPVISGVTLPSVAITGLGGAGFFIVPTGGVYSVSGLSVELTKWVELR